MNRWRFPFSFGITGAGFCFILLVFLLAVTAVRTGHNQLYLIVALMLSATLASGAVARLSLRSIFVSIQVPQNVFVGERVSIKVTLKNQKRLFPAFSILVEDLTLVRARRRSGFMRLLKLRHPASGSEAGVATPALHHAAYFPAILPGESRSELISQSFERRGQYHLDGLRLSTRFPFGFFRRGERVSVTGDILVYPRIREISSDLHLLPFLPGKLEGKRAGPGESLFAIRKYREGDDARLIHWKATAKTGTLMAREYAREEESEFCLILDTAVHEPDSSNSQSFEKAVSLAASLAAHFIKEGAEFELLTPEELIPRGKGIDHLYRVLRALAVARFQSLPAVAGSTEGGIRSNPIAAPSPEADLDQEFSENIDRSQLLRILSEKVFKIILTSRFRGTLPASVWHSSYVIYFDEL